VIRVYDFATTSQGASRLLKTRVMKIDSLEGLENFIVCPSGRWTELMKREGVKIKELPMSRSLTPIWSLLELIAAYRLLRNDTPDIIHTHNSKAGALVRLAAWVFNRLHQHQIVIIHQVHGFHFIHLSGFRRWIFKLIEAILSLFTDYLLFQNQYEYTLARRNMFAKSIYIGNGVSFDELLPYLPKEKAAYSKTKTVVCVARIEPVKNHAMLIEALRMLKDQYGFTDFRTILIGEGDHSHLDPMIRRYGLADHIKFTGPLDHTDVLRYLQNADLSILTSKKEGKPRAIIESMVLSVPCVGTNVIGTNEVIIDGLNGFLADLHDYMTLANRMHRLLTDNALWQKVSKNARKYAEKHFDEDAVIAKIVDLYSTLLKAKRKDNV
jgi:glycosyltransferase involved in cell wall biosynthesis